MKCPRRHTPRSRARFIFGIKETRGGGVPWPLVALSLLALAAMVAIVLEGIRLGAS